MSRCLHGIRMGALALTFAAMLVNCGGDDDGNGGGGGGAITLRRFFGMNGDGNCTNVVVTVDLAAAGAVLARSDGDLDCAIDAVLAGNGCHGTFTELENGDTLRVTISGCTIPATTNLFICGFEDADLSELTSESSAQCTCATAGCDNSPPLCIDDNLDPRSCEDCDNNKDDDGNGLKDCADPNCEHSPLCEGSPATTIETVTTSTLPSEPLSINFLLTSSSAPVGALQLTVNYASAPGQFEGIGGDVECVSNVPGALFAPNDNDATRRLSLGLISLSGFSAPADLVSCSFLPGTPVPVPHNFTIVVNDASDTDGNPIDVDVDVTVTQ
ncbi:MAG TPA: hypothetical protein VN634_21145 [Candidatus Limnocylindrales bacterium]|nr:hypothetical protein [Candidatus Limnocylindrales bacterium]